MANVWVVLGLFLMCMRHTLCICPPESNNVTVFGPNCGYMCHCVGGAQCDDVTGECQNGCADDWFGPGCQYRNLAIRGSAYHLDDTEEFKRAYYAIDQLLSSCSETNVSEWGENREVSPFFRIYWDHIEPIRALRITPKDKSLGYFIDGFNITVENITSSKQGETVYVPSETQVCYSHKPDDPLDTTFEIYCDGGYLYGNQIRIQLNDKFTQLALCEVKVYGGRNVAFKKATTQKSTAQNSGSEFAVDGITIRDRCTMTSFNFNPTWEVDLATEHFIHSIEIFKYTDIRIRYYKIFERLSGNDGWQLYHDDADNYYPQTYIAKATNTQVLRLLVESDSFRLRICEVQIFGDCPDNLCGLDCSVPCHCRQFDHGDVVYGKCTHGCADRWTGLNGSCNTECENGKWGETCTKTCGMCYEDDPCDVRTGSCPNGCVSGVNGSACTETCSDGTFGRNCRENCSATCGDGCNVKTGVCYNGCQPGWQGDFCELECSKGTFGQNCTSICNVTCLDGCHHVNGSCDGGCVSGMQGDYCDQECSDGYWGASCGNQCGHCADQPCNTTSGHCGGMCLPGYDHDHDPLCMTECINGTFGQNCTGICNTACISGCNQVNGSCDGDCVSGMQGDYCDQECSDGTWGPSCQNQCGQCDTPPCNKTNGHCESVCIPGYVQDQLCQTECPALYYGPNCTESCGKCSKGSACRKSDGVCLDGCEKGFHGTFCLQGAEVAQATSQIPLLVGIIGGAVGFVLIVCIAICVGLTQKRKRAKASVT